MISIMKNKESIRREVWAERLRERDRNQKWLNGRFPELDDAGLYLGDEMNTHHFDWDHAVRTGRINGTFRICLANMMATGVTFNAPALPLFYELLDSFKQSWVVERTLCPPTRWNQDLMKKDGISPFAVESKMPLTAFDCLCLSMDLSCSAAAVPWIILNSGIPVFFRDRNETDPFVILGGSSLVNPGPFHPFIDIMFFGEGEEVLPELLSLLEEGRRNGLSRDSILLKAVQMWDCIYVPRFYEERFDDEGRYTGTFPVRSDVPERVHFYHVKDLDQVFVSTRPFLNFCVDMASNSHYEISRGCEGKCSFCLGGFTTLPFRPKSAGRVEQIVDDIVQNTGNLAVSPVSFNSVSHPQINRIIHNLNDSLGDRVRLVSLRMDGFSSNPELCCFVSMQERGRISFGVEGASQRLRNLVSKNLSEEQILDTMRQVCRNGYRTVKFMMIAGLPTESAEDLEEFYNLAVKIRAVFDEEAGEYGRVPHFLITWMTLLISPHTPLQWAAVPRSILTEYAEFTQKIQDLGFKSIMPEVTSEHALEQLFLRGDSRLAELLLYLAMEGDVRHNDRYSHEAEDKVIRFLEEHHLPPLSYWFREYSLEDPLPWDIVESPASKEYLWRRYQAMKKGAPQSDPVCSVRCSGCGSCDSDQRRALLSLPALREEDRKIGLRHPVRKTEYKPVQYVLLEYTYDSLHSVVIPAYWNCEIRLALFKANVSFDPDSVESFGSSRHDEYTAAGFNATSIALCRHYDVQELKELIESYAGNFHVRQIREIPHPLRVREVTYRMRIPETADPGQLTGYIEKRLEEKDWLYLSGGPSLAFPYPLHLRSSVRQITVEGHDLFITMGPAFADPRKVYRYLFDIPQDQTTGQIPECISFVYENQGILDRCLTRGLRDSFIRYRESKPEHEDDTWNDMVNYISSATCANAMKKLIRRDYSSVPAPFHYRIPKNMSGRMRDIYCFKGSMSFLFKLIAFALRDYDWIYSDGLYSFRVSKTAQDFLRRLRDNADISNYYIIKADVSNYVGSIIPEKLIPMLERIFGEDPALLDLMKFILLRRECIEPGGTVTSCEPGGLGGIPLANIFMNVYLMDLDSYFFSVSPMYCRFSDDIIIYARSREEADSYRTRLLEVVEDKGLSTNPGKTYMIEPGDAVEILGCKLKDGIMDISDHSKEKVKRKIRICVNNTLYAKRAKGLTDEECGRRVAGFCNRLFYGMKKNNELTWARWLFPCINTADSLKEIDHYVQDAIRRCMSGSSRRKRFRITYQELKELGYKSLVHEYYHFKEDKNKPVQ